MGNEDILETVREVLTQYLLDHNMRKMVERYTILEYVYQHEGLFPVDDIYEEMDKKFHVSRPTIYSALDLFVRCGLAVHLHFGSRTLYEKSYGVRDHFYQVCYSCGAVKRLSSPQVSAAIKTTRRQGFRMDSVTMCFNGLCLKCQMRERRAHQRYLRDLQQKKQQ